MRAQREIMIGEMRVRGWHPVGSLTSWAAGQVVDYLKTRPAYPGDHVRYRAAEPRAWSDCLDARVLCWHHEDVLTAPHLLEFALFRSPLAAAWLRVENPVLYSVNIFCTRPGGPVRADIQDWHRDADDVRFVPLFVALTHGVRQEVRTESGAVSRIEPSAGDAFFSDTMLEHRGEPPETERIIFWARWGVSERPAAYEWDQTYPVDRRVLGERWEALSDAERRQLRLLVRS